MNISIFTLLILLAIFLLIGAAIMFFVMRNNPRLFNIDKILKKLRDDKKAAFIAYIKDKASKFL